MDWIWKYISKKLDDECDYNSILIEIFSTHTRHHTCIQSQMKKMFLKIVPTMKIKLNSQILVEND